MPKVQSLILSAVLAPLAFLIQQYSPRGGYVLSLLALVMMVVASYTSSIWPSRRQAERPVVFALFWGLMIGLVLPFVVSEYVL